LAAELKSIATGDPRGGKGRKKGITLGGFKQICSKAFKKPKRTEKKGGNKEGNRRRG